MLERFYAATKNTRLFGIVILVGKNWVSEDGLIHIATGYLNNTGTGVTIYRQIAPCGEIVCWHAYTEQQPTCLACIAYEADRFEVHAHGGERSETKW